jgi:SHS2 domain-containing protein
LTKYIFYAITKIYEKRVFFYQHIISSPHSLIGFFPFFLLGNIIFAKELLNLNIDNSVSIVATIIPIPYSIIALLITYLSNRIKKKTEGLIIERNKVNGQILNYNTIILKCFGLYNNLMNHTFYIDNCIKELSNSKEFIDIINVWKKGTANKIYYSDDLRQAIKQSINNITNAYFTSNVYDNNIEYLSAIKVQDIIHEAFTVEDKIFLFSLRNCINFTNEDKDLLLIFPNSWSDGDKYKNAFLELMEHIESLKKIFENEVRIRNISREKLSTLLYNVILSFFHYTEVLCMEVVLLDLFIEKLRNNFRNYYKSVHLMYKTLDEMIDPSVKMKNENIKDYINIDVLYKYFNIEKAYCA